MKPKPLREIVFWILLAASIAVIVKGIFLTPNLMSGGPYPKTTCINQLNSIENAKDLWAEESHAASNASPTFDDLKKFLAPRPNDALPKCPAGGVYTIGTMTNPATCSVEGHALK